MKRTFMPAAQDIVRHHDQPADENPWVRGKPLEETPEVVAHDPAWPGRYAQLAGAVRGALGPAALVLEHVGSTAVPGLPAKPVIDIDLTVSDPTNEAAYVPPLEALGYTLIIREPSWHQHRCLRLENPRVNLHVFGPGCPETIRHALFRDWLRGHPEDRELYAKVKRAALDGARNVQDYNRSKQDVIRAIYGRAFKAAGLL